MNARPKYLFDLDFSAGGEKQTTISIVEHDRRRADAESVAYRKGFAAAETQARTSTEQHAAAALARIAEAIEKLNRNMTTIETRLETEAIEVAVAVANKLASALIAREPFAEIGALATECFNHLVTAPHVVVRLNEALYVTAKDKLEEIAAPRGFQGRLVVMADADIKAGDCRIEWADGGVNRDRAQIEAAIEEMVDRYVAARTDGGR